MNMYDWAKEKDELIEVIYPSMDGNVYFSELETGAATRDKLYLGFPFKGCGTIDPRGYPLLYAGAGYSGAKGAARIFVVSLVDGSILYTFGYNDRFAPRGWTAADAAPLVCAETDQLIYPSENGTIYIIKLNSEFDPGTGTMTIDPSTVKWRFRGKRSQSGGKYWLGMEDSPVIWRGHLIISDNGGHLICLDLNTLEPVWVQDTLDDTNCSPALELEDGHPYIYISTSFHGGWRTPEGSSAAIPVWKIDAVTGEVVWRTDYKCYTVGGISGGVLGTAALGKHELSELVFVPVARTPAKGAGILAALDKRTGEAVWEFRTNQYAWSSPVCVYDKSGKGYIIFCTSGGYMYLLDGLSGDILDTMQLGSNVEASPAVYESTIVVGTRGMKIWGVKLT
jgi:outer membrane protein assembly factor BamB